MKVSGHYYVSMKNKSLIFLAEFKTFNNDFEIRFTLKKRHPINYGTGGIIKCGFTWYYTISFHIFTMLLCGL